MAIKVNISIRKLQKKGNVTVADIFRKTVSKHPQKAAFIFEQTTWTFQGVEDYSNRIANYFKSQGYKKGDVVALFLNSCPEFVCIWLGLSKIGVITALINTNLRLESLWHCISAADPRAVIFGTELSGKNNYYETVKHVCFLFMVTSWGLRGNQSGGQGVGNYPIYLKL